MSFDSTRVSANDVGYPIDVIIYKKDSKKINVKRFEESELGAISEFWGQKLTQSVNEVPDDWIDEIV